MAAKDDILAPFDFSASPSMSSQLFEAAPGIFGDGDGVSPLQGINRVMVGGPLDLLDLIGRGGDVAMRAAAEGAEALTGSKRLGRDIYGFGQAIAPLIGSSPSALSGARYPSTTRAASSDRAPSGITLAIEGPPKPAGLLPSPPKRKILEGEIVSGPSDAFLQAQARRDKASSKAMKDSIDEELDYLGLEDSFQTIKNDIEDGLEGAVERGFEPVDAEGFFDDFQDTVMYRRMQAEERGERPNMGEIIAEELPKKISDYERTFGLFVDSNDLTNKIAKTADDVYNFGVGKAKKRRDDAARAVSDLRAERNRLAMENRQREYYRSIGITDDMTDDQIRDILYERQTGMQRDLAGAGIPEAKPQKPNLRVVVDNEDLD